MSLQCRDDPHVPLAREWFVSNDTCLVKAPTLSCVSLHLQPLPMGFDLEASINHVRSILRALHHTHTLMMGFLGSTGRFCLCFWLVALFRQISYPEVGFSRLFSGFFWPHLKVVDETREKEEEVVPGSRIVNRKRGRSGRLVVCAGWLMLYRRCRFSVPLANAHLQFSHIPLWLSQKNHVSMSLSACGSKYLNCYQHD